MKLTFIICCSTIYLTMTILDFGAGSPNPGPKPEDAKLGMEPGKTTNPGVAELEVPFDSDTLPGYDFSYAYYGSPPKQAADKQKSSPAPAAPLPQDTIKSKANNNTSTIKS